MKKNYTSEHIKSDLSPTYELMFAIGRIYSLIAPILVENDTLPYVYKIPYTNTTNINNIIRHII